MKWPRFGLRCLVEAQQDYFQQTHDGDTVQQYAQKFISEPKESRTGSTGRWPKASRKVRSVRWWPMRQVKVTAASTTRPQPFHGYFYRILTGQGANAMGGAKSYLVDGKMTGGFAFVAYPAEYRNSGVMTFLVDQSGIVIQKDLGPKTVDSPSDDHLQPGQDLGNRGSSRAG